MAGTGSGIARSSFATSTNGRVAASMGPEWSDRTMGSRSVNSTLKYRRSDASPVSATIFDTEALSPWASR